MQAAFYLNENILYKQSFALFIFYPKNGGAMNDDGMK